MKKFVKWNALFLIIGVVVVMLSLSGCMAPTPPLAPILSVVSEGNNSVTISWSENSNVEGFYIYESTDGISFNEITSTGAQTNSYTITGLNQNTTYYFEVQAYNANGEAMSNIVKAITLYEVFGQVTYNGNGLAGVTISFSDGLPSVTTNPDGSWYQGGLTGSVTITPLLSGYTFNPSSTTVTGPNINVNFVASAIVTYYSVSGQVTYNGNGLGGVTISFSDGLPSVTTNSQGYWSQGGLTGSVTITPSLSGYTFTPSSITVTGPSSNVNFFASAPNTIYVTNLKDNTVSVINGQTNNVVATIPVGNDPQEVGVNIVTGMIYVTNNSSNSVSVINGQTNSVIATIPVVSEPAEIGVNPITNMIYVANMYGIVNVINGQTNNVVQTISVGNDISGLGINPTTNMIYITNYGNNTVSVINGQTNSVVSTINVVGPSGIGVNPITNMIYIANPNNNKVSVINGQTNTVVATIPVGSYPIGIGINPTTNMIYVANYGDNTVSVINGQTNSVVSTINVVGSIGIGVNPITNMIYIANPNNNTVSVINGQTNTVVATIPVGNGPDSVGVLY